MFFNVSSHHSSDWSFELYYSAVYGFHCSYVLDVNMPRAKGSVEETAERFYTKVANFISRVHGPEVLTETWTNNATFYIYLDISNPELQNRLEILFRDKLNFNIVRLKNDQFYELHTLSHN